MSLLIFRKMKFTANNESGHFNGNSKYLHFNLASGRLKKVAENANCALRDKLKPFKPLSSANIESL